MKKYIFQFFIVAFSVGISFTSVAQAQSSHGYAGTWYSASGGTTITITEKNGFVDISGIDSQTKYTCTGIIEKTDDENFVECYGSGMNFASNLRFFFKTKLKMVEKGRSMDESWEAKTLSGGRIVETEGDATYRKTKPAKK
jgi:hypothetical protein